MVRSNYWTGLTQTTSFSVPEAIHAYSVHYLLLSLVRHLSLISRGHRSRAYLINCNEKSRRATSFEQKPTPSLCLKNTEAELYYQHCLEAHLFMLIKYAHDL